MKWVEKYDGDNQDGYGGEEHWLFLGGGQTYGLVLAGDNKEETGDCGVYLYGTTVTDPQDRRMDLTQADPELTQGDFWKWDATEKTLTLKDGFFFNYVGTGPAILLPGGSTVEVEGRAKVSSWGDGIFCADGNSTLTILGDGLDDSLSILAQEDGVYGPGGSQVTVQNCNLGIRAEENGIHTYGLLVEDSYIYIESGDDGVESFGTRDVVIDDSTVRIHAGDDGLDCSSDDVSIIVSGGELYFNVNDCTLIAGQAVLTDVTYDLRGRYGWFFRLENEDDFVLPGLLCMYDREGNKLYSGEWPENYDPFDV
ncbi:MAG: carbohydrate-binding domain-containing protein [Firmicutes bacterium]|nr:carbohydrate-binding domain-containing protein [Bacillota bacterium]